MEVAMNEGEREEEGEGKSRTECGWERSEEGKEGRRNGVKERGEEKRKRRGEGGREKAEVCTLPSDLLTLCVHNYIPQSGVSLSVSQLKYHGELMWLNPPDELRFSKGWKKGHGPQISCFGEMSIHV